MIRQPPSTFSARVRIDGGVGAGVGLGEPEAAERLAGAQASAASAASAPRVPQRSIEPQTSEVWTETTVRGAESPRPTSSTISP